MTGKPNNCLTHQQFFQLCNAVKKDITSIENERLGTDEMARRYPEVCDFPIGRITFKSVYESLNKPLPKKSQQSRIYTTGSNQLTIKINKLHSALVKLTNETDAAGGLSENGKDTILDLLNWG